MPGFTTHYLFGVDACRRLTSTSMHNMIRRDHSAYALGLQGPDLFFYYLPSYLMHRKNIGDLAHRKDTGQFFGNLLQSRKLFAGKKHSLSIADAYICGFMGHYTLDCTIHPYVYAFTGYNAQTPPSNTDIWSACYFERNSIPNFYMRKSICILPVSSECNHPSNDTSTKSNCTDAVLCLPEHLSGNFRK